jgi:hypothetical protein
VTRSFLPLCALLLTCCETRNATLRWWKEHTTPLVQSHSSQTDVLGVLGKPYSIDKSERAKQLILQFNSPRVTATELDALKFDSTFFYQIDPDNTLFVCFDSANRAVQAYFGRQ